MALPTRARPSFSHHQSLPSGRVHKPLSLLYQRADRRSKKNHNPSGARTKPHYRKLTRMKKQRVLPQTKGQDKTLQKQLNEVEIGNLPEKEFRITIVKMIRESGKTMEKMQEMSTEVLEELKNRDEQHTRRNQKQNN